MEERSKEETSNKTGERPEGEPEEKLKDKQAGEPKEKSAKKQEGRWKGAWEKNWEKPLFCVAVVAFFLLVLFFSGKKGFYIPVSGNQTKDVIALMEDKRCDAMFLRTGIDSIRADFPADTGDTETVRGTYHKFGNFVWMEQRYLGVGMFSYLIVIDTKFHTETRDGLKRVSVWKRVSMKNPRSEEELLETGEQLLGGQR